MVRSRIRSRSAGSAGRSAASKNTPLLVPPRMYTAGIRICGIDLRSFEVALEYAHVDQRRLRGPGPQVLAAEAHVVRGLVLRRHAMGVGIGEGIRGRFGNHHA